MGWILLVLWFFLGITTNIVLRFEKCLQPSDKGYKFFHYFKELMVWSCIGLGAIFALWCLGWVWYFFCSGFLVFCDQPFFDKVICGLISLLPLGCVIGLIAIAFGWDPWRK